MSIQFVLVNTKIVAKEEQYTYQSGAMKIIFRAGKQPWTWIVKSTEDAKKYVEPLIEAFVQAGIDASKNNMDYNEACKILTVN